MEKRIIITIPQYIRQVKLSDKQRPVYWEWNGKTIKAKSKKLLQHFISPDKRDEVTLREGNVIVSDLKEEYALGVYRGDVLVAIRFPNGDTEIVRPEASFTKAMSEAVSKYYLIEQYIKERIVANRTKVGTPRIEIIKGQDFYNNRIQEHARGIVIQAIKESFVEYVKDIPVITNYPVRVKCYLYDTVKNNFDNNKLEVAGQRWDVGNRVYPYAKAMLDLLSTGKIGDKTVMQPKLIDDDRLHVTEDPQGGIFCPIEADADRKLVFVIAPDDENFSEAIKDFEQERLLLIKNNKYYAGTETIIQ